MKKVLIVSDTLEHYRIPMFESLCDRINLTIAHSSESLGSSNRFLHHPIALKSKGPFITYENLPNFNEFDIVILPFNIRCSELFLTLFRKRNYKLFVFGIGVSASYNKLYDQDKKLDRLKMYILKKVDGAIFYDQYPFIKWFSLGINPTKLSIAYNTVSADNKFSMEDKTLQNFLFIGSLYKQKKIFDLLNAYKIIVEKFSRDVPNLEIIGGGDEFENIKKWIISEKLDNKIILHGQINNADILRPIFNRSIACISPGQAGLSVQKCFSYGIPFITSYNAITGGESSSIIEQETGFLYDGTIKGLVEILTKIITKEVDMKEMSNKSHQYYENFRNLEIWKNGFLKNIEF